MATSQIATNLIQDLDCHFSKSVGALVFSFHLFSFPVTAPPWTGTEGNLRFITSEVFVFRGTGGGAGSGGIGASLCGTGRGKSGDTVSRTSSTSLIISESSMLFLLEVTRTLFFRIFFVDTWDAHRIFSVVG